VRRFCHGRSPSRARIPSCATRLYDKHHRKPSAAQLSIAEMGCPVSLAAAAVRSGRGCRSASRACRA
jgi:hypothetical protein